MEKITIRAFSPSIDRESTIRYVIEHARVLEAMGVYQALHMNYAWCADPDSSVVVAEHEQLGIVGGVRLQRSKPELPLPMEHMLSPLDEGVRTTMSLLQPHGNAEICGLWNAHRFAGRGVPMLLTAAAVSLASQLRLRSIVSISASYSMEYLVSCGFTSLRSLGNDGEFTFPVPSIRSFAMVNTDLFGLEKAAEPQRQRLISLRLQPEQVRVEMPKRTELEVQYRLVLEGTLHDRGIYDRVHQERLRYSA